MNFFFLLMLIEGLDYRNCDVFVRNWSAMGFLVFLFVKTQSYGLNVEFLLMFLY